MEHRTRREAILYRAFELACMSAWPEEWASHMVWFAGVAEEEFPQRRPRRNNVEVQIVEVKGIQVDDL